MSKINLGSKVKDPVTGVIGVAESKTTYLYGCPRVYIQPAFEDGKNVDGITVDEPQIDVLASDYVRNIPPDALKHTLGEIVYDPISKITSVITAQSVYLNGCVRVYLEPIPVWYKKTPECYWLHQQQVISKGKNLIDSQNCPSVTRSKGGPAGACPKY